MGRHCAVSEASERTRHQVRLGLPAEAEWEYACKAGGAQEAGLGAIAWYRANSGDQTQPVATNEPNAWGLYDMHGNVAEWVQDWYSPDYYENSPAANPKGPEAGPETGSAHTASFAAVAGTIPPRTAGQRFAVSIFPSAASIISAFAS
jgi:formylglycine-generating enzyme required for sulfatase activity